VQSHAQVNPLWAHSNRRATDHCTAIRCLVHWPLMGWLLHLVQRGGAWACCGATQSPPQCTMCNSPPMNGQPPVYHLHIIQGDHLSGKPGNVGEFDSCRGNVRDFTKNQGKILAGKSCLKLFIVSCIFASIHVFSWSLFCVKYEI